MARNVRHLAGGFLSRTATTMFRGLETFVQAVSLWLGTLGMDRFLRIGTLLFVATMFTNVLNFLFQVAMGRMLIPADYGTMNALLSTFMIAAIPFTTISMILTRQASVFKAQGQLAGIHGLFRWTYRRLLAVGLPALAVFLLFAPMLRGFLQMETTLPIILMGLVIFLSVAFPVNLAFLGGLQHFIPMAIASGSLGPLKLSLCVLFVALGLGINGVFIGHILCYTGLFLISYWPIRQTLRHVSTLQEKPRRLFLRAYPELLANLALAFMTQFDLVLVKHLFPAETVGTYAVAAVFGRAVMYLPGGLILALFPMVAEHHALNKSQTHMLWKALTYTLLLSGCGTLLYWLFPEAILTLLFGAKFLEAAPLLTYYGIAMLPMALLLIIMNFHIARGNGRVWVLIALGAALEMLTILLWHQDLTQILLAVFVGGFASLVLSIWPIVRDNRDHVPYPKNPNSDVKAIP
jgi:O-antigen/teichoic acid export membrane protein